MKKACLICAIASIYIHTAAYAESWSASDSCTTKSTHTFCAVKTIPVHNTDKFIEKIAAGIPLIVTGILTKKEERHFDKLRSGCMTTSNSPYANYTQYLPAAVMFGMKAAGIESRSSWGHMIASDAISAALMGCSVEAIKRMTKATRPDGSDNRSFPSGHTATAFMTATMLTKEYGHISPWIGIGAYTAAASTGIMRIANNKHWISDVMTGAGIGILATELGYCITDMIFQNRDTKHGENADHLSPRYSNPSFLSIYVGANIPLGSYKIDDKHEARTSTGYTAGIEGAYFFNPYIGIGGCINASDNHLIINHTQAENDTEAALSLMAGTYFSYPVSQRWLIGSKLLAGTTVHSQTELNDETVLPRTTKATFGSGISLTYKMHEHYTVCMLLNYNLTQPHSAKRDKLTSTITTGMSFGINL